MFVKSRHVLLLASVLCAPVWGQQVEWFNFSGLEDSQMLSDGGQVFPNVCGEIDMIVFGQAGNPPIVVQDDVNIVVTTNDLVHSSCFSFEFEAEVDLMLRVDSLEAEETIKVGILGGLQYIHESGSFPIVVADNDYISLVGTGLGAGPDGASRGYIKLDATTGFSWCHVSDAEGKTETLSLGKLVPEPSAMVLWILSGLCLFGWRARG